MQQFLRDISGRIRKHKLVVKHQVLLSDQWTKSSYVLLSSIVQEELQKLLSEDEQLRMGTMVSYKTLQSILQGSYKLKFPIDPRSLNTLNKVVRFIDFADWNDFYLNSKKETSKKVKKYKPKNRVKFLVQEGIENAFKAIHNLSTNGTVNLDQYYQTSSPAFNKIAELIAHQKEANNTIDNAYNPSSCEILECKVKEINEDTAKVYTKEYWLLCWWNKETKRYVNRYKEIGEHYYMLERCPKENCWKIRNDASLTDLYDSTAKTT